MSEIYHFEWGIDTVGYAFGRRGGEGNSLLSSIEYEVVCGCGGPLRFYRPLEEHQGLWRQFGDQCTSREGIIPFVSEFGLPYDLPTGFCPVENAINLATFLRAIATYHDFRRSSLGR